MAKDSKVSLQSALEHHQAGRLQQAEALYKKMPGNADAMHLLGVIAYQSGHNELAIKRILPAIRANPANAAYYCNIGSAYQALKKWDDALASYRKALALNPDYVLVHNNLGITLKALGKMDEALLSFQKALALQPDYVEALSNLGSTFKDLQQFEQAAACYQRALALKPDFSEAYFNLGNVFSAQLQLKNAVFNLQMAIEFKPDFYLAHYNLGVVFKDQGKVDDAIACFQKTLALNPEFADAQSNLLFCHNYHPDLSAEQIYAVYQQWNQQHAEQFTIAAPPCANAPDPERRLKIGYVSADFRNHSVIHFSAPLIELHDKSRFEMYCYYNQTIHDGYTDRIIAASDHWIPCSAMSDDELAQRIRSDGIDILIDLSGHTLGHRLLVFARKPAPVQATCFGYGYTTGLQAMDYFIGDPSFTPIGCENLFSEKLARLPHCPAAYLPPATAPEPNALPALKNGYVTFACLSRTERINAAVIETWGEILLRVPDARLRLDSRFYSDVDLCRETEAKFVALGVPASRLQIGYSSPVWSVYQEVDIILDCFPHNSGTTTWEAIWMGIPVLTLAGRPSVGRIGASLLTCIGKPEWIATSAADYVERAVALADDIAALAQERSTLRQTMQASPLLDQKRFVRDMEAAYRDMWQHWCHAGQTNPPAAIS